MGIALPLAVYLVRRPQAYRLGLPIVEVVASFPATALFPVFILALVPVFGFEGVSILMLITGMEWYLFFNILSGVRAIPPDLDEAARAFGLTRWQYYKRLLLPAILPAFITGSITAFGGGWNTLIVAEYFQVQNQTFSVPGIGRLIDVGNAAGKPGLPLMVAALFAMVITVVAINELFWKPRYRVAVEKFRID
ncbi:MAG: ABC transporter permease subunit [Candidatus Lutacidiplasmatales archaeon]